LHIDGVSFPLEVSAAGVRLALAVPALEAPQLVLAQLCNAGVTPQQRELFARGEDFAVPNLSAVRVPASDPDAREAIAAWQAFAGRDPGPDVYLVSASFSAHALAVPPPTMARLIAELGPLCDGVRSGALEPRLAEPGAEVPPPDATAILAPDDAAAATALAPPALASDDVLRDLENSAAMLDQLDPEDTLREGLPSEQLDALTAARRRTVLLGLRIAGLFSPAAIAGPAAAATRARLLAAGFPTLAGYLDAAVALAAYLTSRTRAQQLPPASEDLLLSAVSLDWFRKAAPSAAPSPAPRAADDAWLTRCEAAFARARAVGPRAGRTYTKLDDGTAVWLHFRTDVGPHVSLWRALEARRPG
jgi:hypothetical protein